MRAWFNWRTAVGSIAFGLLFSGVLFNSTGRSFALSGLDLFFAVTTVVSLAFNLWQLFRDRYKYTPLKNSLIGLFNDLKSRQMRAFERAGLIRSAAGASVNVDAVRLEFTDYVRETLMSLEQIREHVVAAINTLDPDVSTQQIFRAAEFGLTEKEKRFREEGMDRLLEHAHTRQGAGPPPTKRPSDTSSLIPPQSGKN